MPWYTYNVYSSTIVYENMYNKYIAVAEFYMKLDGRSYAKMLLLESPEEETENGLIYHRKGVSERYIRF